MRPGRRLLLVAAAVVIVLALTVLPNGGGSGIQLRPFASISHEVESVENVLLFMPLGGALAFVGIRFRRAIAFGAALSAAIELVQLAIPGRWTSVDDWIFNTVGTAVGFAVWRLASNSLLQGGKRRGAGAVKRGGLESR